MIRRLIPALAPAIAVLAVQGWAAGVPASALALWEAEPTRVFEAAEVDVEEFLYRGRPVVVFADSPFDPAFEEQMEALLREVDRLEERDVVLIVDTDPAARSDLRLQLRPRGFMLVLIGKDGQIKLRKPLPWTVRELSRSIDKMPIRQREMRERR